MLIIFGSVSLEKWCGWNTSFGRDEKIGAGIMISLGSWEEKKRVGSLEINKGKNNIFSKGNILTD